MSEGRTTRARGDWRGLHLTAGHRPWPIPRRSWAMTMSWHDVLFMHWPVEPRRLRLVVLESLELDLVDGRAWLGIVPFHMTNVRPRGMPAWCLGGMSRFPEMNVRTYVRVNGRPGIHFVSLDAARSVQTRIARTAFGAPYLDALIRCDATRPDRIEFRCDRTHRRALRAAFAANYGPTGAIYRPEPGTLDHFLAERYCFFTAGRGRPVVSRSTMRRGHSSPRRQRSGNWI